MHINIVLDLLAEHVQSIQDVNDKASIACVCMGNEIHTSHSLSHHVAGIPIPSCLFLSPPLGVHVSGSLLAPHHHWGTQDVQVDSVATSLPVYLSITTYVFRF